MPEHFLASLDAGARAQMWSQALVNPDCLVLVAESATEIVGFCSLISSRDADADPTCGELAAIYVDPARVRSGIGSLLVEHAVAAAQSRGFSRLSLWVLRDNAVALAFYRACGFSFDGASKTQPISSFEVEELRLQRSLIAMP
jgi:ribosomal protein S18 acetylase RimI-like enzyme